VVGVVPGRRRPASRAGCQASITRGQSTHGPLRLVRPAPAGARLGVARAPHDPEEPTVSDKSPRQSSSKKSAKTLKEKRHDKKEVANNLKHPTVIPTRRPSK
jgi:hypothetical protein